MVIKIDINDRLYQDISDLCQANNIKIYQYIIDVVMDNFYTLKYGDLNDKINEKRYINKEKEEDIKNLEKVEEKEAKENSAKPKRTNNQVCEREEDKDGLVKKIKKTRILRTK